MGKKNLDPESEAAMEIVKMEQLQESLSKLSNKRQGVAIAHVFETAGTLKTLKMNESQSRFFQLVFLLKAKQTKLYKELGMTWEEFCRYCGINRRWADDNLKDLKPLRAEFLGDFLRFSGVTLSKIKYLGEAKAEGTAEIKDGAIHYDGQVIPVDAEHAEDIEALLDNLASVAEEAKADARAAKRHLKTKQTHIDKLEKSLARYEARAAERDLSPEEDAFITQMENLGIAFDGYMLDLDPESIEALDKNATTIMRAKYLTTLWEMRAKIKAAYDMAVDIYGAGLIEKEDEWVPPKR